MKPTLVILAAGMGSRYGGLKQIDGIGPYGEALIEYSVYDAKRAGFGKVVFIIRENIFEIFKENVGNKLSRHIPVDYVFQEINSPIEGILTFPDREKPWGTAHAVLVAKNHIKEPFAVINADDYYGHLSFEEMSKFLTTECDEETYSMIGYDLLQTLSEHGTVSRGVCNMDNNLMLTEVIERTSVGFRDNRVYFEEGGMLVPLDNDTLVSMNFWGFHPSVFRHIESRFVEFVKNNSNNQKAEFFIPLVINDLINTKESKVKVIPNREKWYGVTYKEDKPIVQQAFAQLTKEGIYEAPLWG
jgi:dTDP-glucose pyrophosphorylase